MFIVNDMGKLLNPSTNKRSGLAMDRIIKVIKRPTDRGNKATFIASDSIFSAICSIFRRFRQFPALKDRFDPLIEAIWANAIRLFSVLLRPFFNLAQKCTIEEELLVALAVFTPILCAREFCAKRFHLCRKGRIPVQVTFDYPDFPVKRIYGSLILFEIDNAFEELDEYIDKLERFQYAHADLCNMLAEEVRRLRLEISSYTSPRGV